MLSLQLSRGDNIPTGWITANSHPSQPSFSMGWKKLVVLSVQTVFFPPLSPPMMV